MKAMRSGSMCVILLTMLCLCVFFGGCAADRSTVDHRASVMNGLADKVNSSTAEDLRDNALDVAWIVENERRAAVNLSDAFHWRKPTYKYPSKRPDSLPYTPEDDVPIPRQ